MNIIKSIKNILKIIFVNNGYNKNKYYKQQSIISNVFKIIFYQSVVST